LIIFDLDGTLFRTDEVFVRAFRSASADLGMQPPDDDDFLDLIGLPSSDCIDVLAHGSDNSEIDELIRKKGENPVQAYIDNAFNLDMLIDTILKPTKRGEAIQTILRHLDLETDLMSRDVTYDIDSSTIILVEGVLLYRKPLDDCFDYRVFLDIPFREMIRRAEERDVPRFGEQFLQRYKEKYIPIIVALDLDWSQMRKNPESFEGSAARSECRNLPSIKRGVQQTSQFALLSGADSNQTIFLVALRVVIVLFH